MALLLPGMRPRMVTAPRVRTSTLDVPIAPRAHVTGLERAAAHGARGPSGFHDHPRAHEEPGHVLGERADLLLLALERDDRPGLAPLQVEGALARLAHGADREVIGRVEIERLAHRGTSPARSPSIAL